MIESNQAIDWNSIVLGTTMTTENFLVQKLMVL